MMLETLHSYPSLYSVGHKATQGLFEGPVLVEEKIDGSQFSFGINAASFSCVNRICSGRHWRFTAPVSEQGEK